MGKCNIDQSIKQKIEGAFAPGRTTLRWEVCESRSQEKLECGPRTIVAMKITKEGMEKNIPVEESVQLAALWQHPYNLHTPAMIREGAAHFINQFTPVMITAPTQFRSRRSNIMRPARTSNSKITCIEINSSQETGP